MTRFEVNGNFMVQQAERLKQRLQGQSYMEFKIEYSNYAGNCSIFVSSDYDCTVEELKRMFYFVALGKL